MLKALYTHSMILYVYTKNLKCACVASIIYKKIHTFSFSYYYVIHKDPYSHGHSLPVSLGENSFYCKPTELNQSGFSFSM